MAWVDMVKLPSEKDDSGDFGNEGLFVDSFTPSESVTNNPLSDKGNTIMIHFGSCPEKVVDCNMILTFPVEFKAQQDQLSEVEKEL